MSLIKHIFFYSIIFILLLVIACDPDRSKYAYLSGTVRINAQIINPRDSIGINDTVIVHLEVPDTVLLNNKPTPLTFANQDGANVGLSLTKIDTTHAGSIGPSTGSIVKATVGDYSPYGVLSFVKNNKKLEATLLFIPKSKGVFFIENQEYGYIDANNQALKLRFNFNYGNINHNHQMLIDSAGAKSDFKAFLQNHLDNELEIYGFKAE